ncbi:hypothetical protein AB3K78_03060 [Leucobacter sp. HNU]|uniref:hypothetical protein n=1 Tax=Leucobacter sp. HNU TaxID=3236805 RepID=UPI003A7FDB6C
MNSTLLATERHPESQAGPRPADPDRVPSQRNAAVREAGTCADSARLGALELREAQLAAQRARAEHEALRAGYAQGPRLF